MTATPEPVIIAAVRTPVGRYGGALSHVRPDDLAAVALRAAVERVPSLDPSEIEEVYLGCANQAGEDNRNVARMALLLAGLPQEIPGITVNRLCASGLAAVVCACQAIRAGEIELAVAGGVESMSRAPLVMGKDEKAFARGDRTVYDTTIGWRFPNPAMAELLPAGEHGRDGRERRRALGREPRRPGRVRAGEPAPLGGGGRRRALRRGAGAGGGVRARRAPPPAVHPRGAGEAAHGVPRWWDGHRGQLQRRQRRRGGARGRQCRDGGAARRRTARALRRLGRGRASIRG